MNWFTIIVCLLLFIRVAYVSYKLIKREQKPLTIKPTKKVKNQQTNLGIALFILIALALASCSQKSKETELGEAAIIKERTPFRAIIAGTRRVIPLNIRKEYEDVYKVGDTVQALRVDSNVTFDIVSTPAGSDVEVRDKNGVIIKEYRTVVLQ